MTSYEWEYLRIFTSYGKYCHTKSHRGSCALNTSKKYSGRPLIRPPRRARECHRRRPIQCPSTCDDSHLQDTCHRNNTIRQSERNNRESGYRELCPHVSLLLPQPRTAILRLLHLLRSAPLPINRNPRIGHINYPKQQQNPFSIRLTSCSLALGYLLPAIFSLMHSKMASEDPVQLHTPPSPSATKQPKGMQPYLHTPSPFGLPSAHQASRNPQEFSSSLAATSSTHLNRSSPTSFASPPIRSRKLPRPLRQRYHPPKYASKCRAPSFLFCNSSQWIPP